MELDVAGITRQAAELGKRMGDEAYFAAVCLRSGIVAYEPPHRLAQAGLGFYRFGVLGGAIAAGAVRHRDRPAVYDELGELSFAQLHHRSNALANAWRAGGLRPGEGVAILARNHRWFLDAVFAGAKCGARIVLLNTSFGGPQITEVAGREGTDLLVYDDEYAPLVTEIEPPRGSWRAWTDEQNESTNSVAAAIARFPDTPPPRTGEPLRLVILTSGTTGTPKGAPRTPPHSLALAGGLLDKVPFRAREVTELCVPMFHALGFAHAMLAVGLGSTLVLRRRFEPGDTLASLQRHGASALVVVPIMLARLVDHSSQIGVKPREHLPDLRVIFSSGSQLGEPLARRAMGAFGPILYNLYGSTELAFATIATPQDLQREPGSVGKVLKGSVVKILDADGHELPAPEIGRIFVGSAGQFQGYTGGGSKETVGGLMASGDLGHFDPHGRLFVDGREDDMIISGGENVFPGEVEELLTGHPAIADAAVIGVDDDQFGQRLKAFVVRRPGARLHEQEVKDYVRDNLARYKAPREVAFVVELPRNQTGKVLKSQLEAPAC